MTVSGANPVPAGVEEEGVFPREGRDGRKDKWVGLGFIFFKDNLRDNLTNKTTSRFTGRGGQGTKGREVGMGQPSGLYFVSETKK